MKVKGFRSRTALALAASVIAGAMALLGAPGALADEPCLPENGCIPGEVEPPIPPDEAGNPQPVTVDWHPIPDVPPAVTFDLGLPAPKHSTCKQKRKHAAASKKCKLRKKRH